MELQRGRVCACSLRTAQQACLQVFSIEWGVLTVEFVIFNVWESVQYVVFAHWMLCCPVGYVEREGLTFRDRLNSSENYLLLAFLLATPSHYLLLLVRQSVT